MEMSEYYGNNACLHRASTEAMVKMIGAGGHELIMVKNKHRFTPLYYACKNKASTEVIMELAMGCDSSDEQIKQKINFVIVEATTITQQCLCIQIYKIWTEMEHSHKRIN